MFKVAVATVVLVALGGVGAPLAVADTNPAYDQCGEAAYVTGLYTDLFNGKPPADTGGAARRAQAYADNAPAELTKDGHDLTQAEIAVLNGASTDALRTDPAIQAWGDVLDWHTSHCS
ncbi:hypothetical protein ACIP5Y_01870 [Nocardia sp. NPDC088792]|uniref:hypothetical protein n=1 Tax=Nocardia sp. NPDC088792 TaxID=3364332 RepID=UPI00382E3D21